MRFLLDRNGWTVTVYEVRRSLWWHHERMVHRERREGLTNAADLADALVEQIEDHRLG